MSDDRANRLRQKRQAAKERAELSDPSEQDEPPKSNERDEPSKQSESAAGETTVKDEQVGTYMYLPETQTKLLKRRFNVLKAEYEFEYDDEFEKNRHFYPLVVKYGLDDLDGLEASEIRERLDGLDG
jgi:hypothetical protein